LRIGPFEIGRISAAQQQDPKPRRELGASGTVNVDGMLVQDEYSADLTGKSALKVYDRMRRSDASVREALQHIFAPIKNANWEVEPASDELEDLEVAEFVKRSYFEWASQPFSEYLNQALLYLVFGHQVFEQVEQIVDAELEITPKDGDPITLPSRQFLTLSRFAQRLPSTIYKWNVEDGDLVSIVQQVFKNGNYENVEIPAEQLIVYVNEREGDDFNGLSLLRTAYKAWVMKELTEKVAAVAIERHGVGINTAYIPSQYRDDDSMLDRIEEMLRDIRSGEFNYLVFPGPKSTAGAAGDGFFFEINSPTGGIPDFTPLLEYHRGEIKGNMLARFAELGHGSTGARAVGSVQSEIWYDALHAVARHISDVNRIAIKRLVDANYPNVVRYPELCAYDIESRNIAEFAAAQAQLTTSGAIIADLPYREFVRKSVDAPPEAEETEQDLQDEKDQAKADAAALEPLKQDDSQLPKPEPPPK
jgi:hypothetical protein